MKIKQLEWQTEPTDTFCSTVLGIYSIQKFEGEYFCSLYVEIDIRFLDEGSKSIWQHPCSSIEDGKKICQKDFEEKLNQLVEKHVEKE